VHRRGATRRKIADPDYRSPLQGNADFAGRPIRLVVVVGGDGRGRPDKGEARIVATYIARLSTIVDGDACRAFPAVAGDHPHEASSYSKTRRFRSDRVAADEELAERIHARFQSSVDQSLAQGIHLRIVNTLRGLA